MSLFQLEFQLNSNLERIVQVLPLNLWFWIEEKDIKFTCKIELLGNFSRNTIILKFISM